MAVPSGAIFFVRDNGRGFPAEQAGRLFNSFHRLHPADEFPGTGVGLVSVSRAIARHGGCVSAESAPGCGCTVFFSLPRGRTAPARAGRPDTESVA